MPADARPSASCGRRRLLDTYGQPSGAFFAAYRHNLKRETTPSLPSFGNASMTWSVNESDVKTFQYEVTGSKMTVNWTLVSTSVGGFPAQNLQIQIPEGYEAMTETYGSLQYQDAGGPRTNGAAFVLPGNTRIFLQKMDASPWTWSMETTRLQGQITFEVRRP